MCNVKPSRGGSIYIYIYIEIYTYIILYIYIYNYIYIYCTYKYHEKKFQWIPWLSQAAAGQHDLLGCLEVEPWRCAAWAKTCSLRLGVPLGKLGFHDSVEQCQQQPRGVICDCHQSAGRSIHDPLYKAMKRGFLTWPCPMESLTFMCDMNALILRGKSSLAIPWLAPRTTSFESQKFVMRWARVGKGVLLGIGTNLQMVVGEAIHQNLWGDVQRR